MREALSRLFTRRSPSEWRSTEYWAWVWGWTRYSILALHAPDHDSKHTKLRNYILFLDFFLVHLDNVILQHGRENLLHENVLRSWSVIFRQQMSDVLAKDVITLQKKMGGKKLKIYITLCTLHVTCWQSVLNSFSQRRFLRNPIPINKISWNPSRNL